MSTSSPLPASLEQQHKRAKDLLRAARDVDASAVARILAVRADSTSESRPLQLVVAHLANFTRVGYRMGFPSGGEWREVFNSDVYENYVNAGVMGNGGRIFADQHPLHEFHYSASLVLPANSLMIFAR